MFPPSGQSWKWEMLGEKKVQKHTQILHNDSHMYLECCSKAFGPDVSILPEWDPKLALSLRICLAWIETDLVEETVEVNVNTFPGEGVEEDVFPVPVSQPQDVAHHGHHSGRSAVRWAAAVPVQTGRGTFQLLNSLSWETITEITTFRTYQDVGSGKVRRNHSWKIGGCLAHSTSLWIRSFSSKGADFGKISFLSSLPDR